MITTPVRTFAARSLAALLALAMVLAPTAGQVTAAETCRVRCEYAGAKSVSCCDAMTTNAGTGSRLDHRDSKTPVDRGPDAGSKYCAGCAARPLIAASTPVNFTFDASPLFAPAPAPTVTHSAEISLAIFHPPRA